MGCILNGAISAPDLDVLGAGVTGASLALDARAHHLPTRDGEGISTFIAFMIFFS